MIELVQADYVVLAVVVLSAVFGLFGGFSGALGFLAGIASSAVVGKFGYAYLVGVTPSKWTAGLGTAIVALLAFGVFRTIVKRVVHGLLAQPADAIFGALVAGITGGIMSLAAIWSARVFAGYEVESSLLTEVLKVVGR